jgi:hypothetical protein
VAVVTYLWRYFGFVGFELSKFKPVPAVSRIWSLVLAVGFPVLGLVSSFQDSIRKTLVGIGISTILVPAIVPDLELPESDSLMKRIYFQTAGKWIVNFLESAVVSVVLLVLDIRTTLGGSVCRSRVFLCGFTVDVGSRPCRSVSCRSGAIYWPFVDNVCCRVWMDCVSDGSDVMDGIASRRSAGGNCGFIQTVHPNYRDNLDPRAFPRIVFIRQLLPKPRHWLDSRSPVSTRI